VAAGGPKMTTMSIHRANVPSVRKPVLAVSALAAGTGPPEHMDRVSDPEHPPVRLGAVRRMWDTASGICGSTLSP
jgi:hypothetical protein